MSAPKNMKEHGLNTTKATYWIHLLPLEAMAFFYRVSLMRKYVALMKPPVMPGKSNDGSVTGYGYLVPKIASFLTSVHVDQKYLDGYNWKDTTDREFGVRGEYVVEQLLEHGIIKFPFQRVMELRTQADQFNACDGRVKWFGEVKWETKTEKVCSGNLFVQIAERGHRPNLVFQNGKLIERRTELPPLLMDMDGKGSTP